MPQMLLYSAQVATGSPQELYAGARLASSAGIRERAKDFQSSVEEAKASGLVARCGLPSPSRRS